MNHPASTPASIQPDKSGGDRYIAILIFLASCAYLCLFRRSTSMDPDEGIILQGAQRILEGQILYRDFFSFFTPGSYYLLALLFKIFGSSLLVARTALAFYGGIFSVFTYLMARRVCSRWAALAAAYLVTITCVPWRFLALHNWDSTLMACLAVYCTVCLIEKPRWGWVFAAGSFASITVLFEQSKGAGLVMGLALGLTLIWIFAPDMLRLSRGQWLTLAIGLAWPCLLTFTYFYFHHALGALLTDWFWPLQHYSQVNRVPYGHLDWSDQTREMLFHSGSWLWRGLAMFFVSPSLLLPVLPIIAIVLLVYWVVEARRGGLAPDRAAYYILICSTLAGLVLSVIVVRANTLHFVHLIPVLYLVLAWIMDGKDIRGSLVNSIRPLVTIGVLIAFTGVGMAFLIASRGSTTVETRRGQVKTSGPDTVLPYVLGHVPAGSNMLVYPYLPLYNYLTGTFNPTRFEYLQPGMHTLDQGEEAIREIAADHTAVVLFEPGFSQKIANSWPNTPLQFVANDPVGDYILEHYSTCKVLRSAAGWPFVYMVRKDLSCPK
jgi:4-amino-4-deoxy-L-arabinose transferase-like glycosyltransferase